MTKGTRVTWTTPDGAGAGVTINDEVDGHILVAIDAPEGYAHSVIWCAVTWLTVAP